MTIIVGFIVVLGAVLGGFSMAGGHVGALLHISELLIIAGAGLGALIVMSPIKVLIDIVKGMVAMLKGSPYGRQAYEDLLKVLYQVFMLARRSGMIALEEHVTSPQQSSIFSKYPSLAGNHHALEFLCGALRPLVDGRSSPSSSRLCWTRNWARPSMNTTAPWGC